MSVDKLESYILELDQPYEELGNNLWIIYESEENTFTKLVVSISDTIVHFRIKVMDIPKDPVTHCELFKKLLEVNAVGLTHGAFAIENNSIVLLDTLEAENLDFNEFQASVESLFLGIIENYPELSSFTKNK